MKSLFNADFHQVEVWPSFTDECEQKEFSMRLKSNGKICAHMTKTVIIRNLSNTSGPAPMPGGQLWCCQLVAGRWTTTECDRGSGAIAPSGHIRLWVRLSIWHQTSWCIMGTHSKLGSTSRTLWTYAVLTEQGSAARALFQYKDYFVELLL